MANELMRSQVPQYFYDFTSPMLLRAPIPQFLHAKLIISALNANLPNAADKIALPIPSREVPDGVNKPYADFEDYQLMLASPIPRQAIQVVNDFGPDAKATGHTVRFNRPKYTNTTHTASSRLTPAGTVIGTSAVPIQAEQTALTVNRYVGPYNSTTGAPGPFAIDVFDAKFSLHSFGKIVDQHFKYDYHKTIDYMAVDLFDQAPTANIIWGGGASADNDLSGENSHPFDWRLLKKAARKMDENNVPRFEDGKRICIMTPLQEEQLMVDPEFQRLSREAKDSSLNPLFKDSYIASVMDWHLFKSNTLTQTANGSSVTVHYAQAFGPEAVGWGLAGLPEIMPHTDDNYGQTVFAVWIAFMAFGVLNENFLYSLRTS
jgi:N4-gp56 family major capsid protein